MQPKRMERKLFKSTLCSVCQKKHRLRAKNQQRIYFKKAGKKFKTNFPQFWKTYVRQEMKLWKNWLTDILL